MAFNVSTFFMEQLAETTPRLRRVLTINGSDYSDRVAKWPTIKSSWDGISPQSVTIDLTNDDKTFNFFRNTKTTMVSSVGVNVGFERVGMTLSGNTQYRGPGLTSGVTYGNQGYVISFWLRAEDWSHTDSYNHNILVIGSSAVTNIRSFSHLSLYKTQTNYLRLSEAWGVYSYHNALDVPPGSYTINSGQLNHFFIQRKNNHTAIYQNTTLIHSLATTCYFDTDSYAIPAGMWIGGKFPWIASSDNTGGITVANLDIIDMSNYSVFSFDVSATYSNKAYASHVGTWSPTLHPVYAPFQHHLNVASPLFADVYTYVVNSWKGSVFSGDYSFTTIDSVSINMFTGRASKVGYNEGKLALTVVDKMSTLSQRVIGSTTSAAVFSSTTMLPSDVAWTVCTCYGGLSSIASTSNPDIDYSSFLSWAAIFSADTVIVGAKYSGTKALEALRSIGRHTQSAIFVASGKLKFNRFSDSASYQTPVNANHIIDTTLEIDENSIINKAWVYGGYSVTSNNWTVNVFNVSTTSINSYGLREDIQKEETFWYTTSVNAGNLASRMLATYKEPFDNLNVKLPVSPILPTQIGDTLTVTDEHLDVFNAWRVMEQALNLDAMVAEFLVNGTQVLNGFTLDTDALDSGSKYLL